MFGPLFVEPTGDFNALDGMYPAEMSGDVLCFIRLYGPDKMPAGVDIIECSNFLQGFLQIVFAEITQAGLPCETHGLTVLPFADGQKHDRVDTSVELLRALLQLGRDLLYVVGDIVHRLAVSNKSRSVWLSKTVGLGNGYYGTIGL